MVPKMKEMEKLIVSLRKRRLNYEQIIELVYSIYPNNLKVKIKNQLNRI